MTRSFAAIAAGAVVASLILTLEAEQADAAMVGTMAAFAFLDGLVALVFGFAATLAWAWSHR